ncbi:ATPase, T2SS/T4P/T4SS family [Pseudovibrio ascidiaceicola]|uniref:ATPase, T2SS/T4P/T4SS family n=1 Tax=Pseudovibrio ascidiaceicola TaxID=285279 RepID=UPI003D36A00C
MVKFYVVIVPDEYITRLNESSGVNPRFMNKTDSMRRDEFFKIIDRASELQVTDVHIEVKKNLATIGFREMGELYTRDTIPEDDAHEILQAAFAAAAQGSSETTYQMHSMQRAAIDPTSSLHRLPRTVVGLRLQYAPLMGNGRLLVIRVHYADSKAENLTLEQLGYLPFQAEQIRDLCRLNEGLIVMSGPTGSGKTTTLAAVMSILRKMRPTKNLLSLEDPPEFVMHGVRQIPVAAGESQAERLEQMVVSMNGTLRLDPDILLVGETKDGASAKLLFEGAMSGHLMLTSLHANDAISVLDRMLDLGVEKYKLRDSSLMVGTVGQLLVRSSNPKRLVDFETGIQRGYIPKQMIDLLGDNCGDHVENIQFIDTGDETSHYAVDDTKEPKENRLFSGREVIAEVVTTDKELLNVWHKDQKYGAFRYWKDELGGIERYEHAIIKALTGGIDPRVMQDRMGPLRNEHLIGFSKGKTARFLNEQPRLQLA